jgi:putative transposase
VPRSARNQCPDAAGIGAQVSPEYAQYASEAFQQALLAIGAKGSMSSTGNCFDNAAAESFFSTLKQELIHRHPWPTKARAKAAIADYIDHFYNPRRRHSFVGHISPLDFELQFMHQAA